MRRFGLVLLMMVVALVVGSGVALAAVKFGTDGRDLLVGTDVRDQLFGKGGSDGLVGRAADDVLYGGDDFIFGGSVRNDEIFRDGWRIVPDGEDKLYGDGGNDCMFAGFQDRVLYGGPVNEEMGFYCYDLIFDTGEDVYNDGPSKDFTRSWEAASRKAERDKPSCGGGRDVALTRKLVRLYAVERVDRAAKR